MSRKIKIFDTTLRDGEQSPGASMTMEQKIEMAEALESLGVDRIEAGFPVSSPVQFEAVKKISEVVKNAQVAGLARCVEGDINAVRDSLANADNLMLHLFIAGSPLHRQYKLKKSKEEILESIRKHLAYARKFFPVIEFSPEDASRTEPDFLMEMIRTALEWGASVINIPDTVGYSIPGEFANLIRQIRTEVPEIADADLSVHCHNDLGLASANTLAALEAGATQAEVTLNGIGERAGNCPLEELVMTLHVRKDLFDFTTGIRTEYLYPTSKLLQNITGLIIPRNKPIFGDNVFSHESGIHQHGVMSHRETYEIMDPSVIGRTKESLVMGRHSGKHALKEKLTGYNVHLTDEQFDKVFKGFTVVADKKKEVYDEDLFSIVSSVLGGFSQGKQLAYFHSYTGNTMIPSATVKIGDKGEEKIASSTGDGPVDAVFNALDSCLGISARLEEFIIQAIGAGKDAQGQVKLTLGIDGGSYTGKASSTDIIEASAMAYLNAANRYFITKTKGA